MRHLLTLVLLFSFSTAFTQNQKIDSLQQKVNKAKGTNRILQLNELAIAYWDVDLKKTIILGNKALRLAEQYKFNKVKARTYNIIGVAYYKLGKLYDANSYYDKCIETAKTFGTEDDLFKSLSNKITLYSGGLRNRNLRISSNFDTFIKLCIKRKDYNSFTSVFINVLSSQIENSKDSTFSCLKYLQDLEKNAKIDLKPSIYIIYGVYYNVNNEQFKGIEKLKEVLKLTQDERVKVMCLASIGDIFLYLRRYNESFHYYNESLHVLKSAKFENIEAYKIHIKAALGTIFISNGKFRNAYQNLISTITDKNKVFFFKIDMCKNYSNLGLAYLGLDSIAKAEYYINWSLSLSDSINSIPAKLIALQSKVKLLKKQNRPKELRNAINSIANIIDSIHDDYTTHLGYQQLTDYYKSAGEYKKSLHYLEKWVTVNDSIKSTESLQLFNEFQTKYETEKKEQQIVLQDSQIKSQHRFLIVLSISGVLLLIAFVFIYILYNKRNQAYKQLVLQSIGKIDNEELLDDSELQSTDIDLDEKQNKIANQKNNNTLVDEATKNQIKEELKKQLSNKVYLDDGLSINKLATLCNTNRTYLSQVINETHQMNFNTFINKLRIDEAKKLFLDESFETPLKHLSTQLGFNTYTVFNDAFKRFIGVTPAFFLKTVKAERENSK